MKLDTLYIVSFITAFQGKERIIPRQQRRNVCKVLTKDKKKLLYYLDEQISTLLVFLFCCTGI